MELSPYRTLHLGNASRVSREFSVEAMRLVLDLYVEPSTLDYVVEALGIIHTVFKGAEAQELAEAANRKK